MVNLAPWQVIAIGVLVVFGPAIGIGFAVGHFLDWFAGIICGVIVFIIVVLVAQAEVTKWLKQRRGSPTEDDDGSNTGTL